LLIATRADHNSGYEKGLVQIVRLEFVYLSKHLEECRRPRPAEALTVSATNFVYEITIRDRFVSASLILEVSV